MANKFQRPFQGQRPALMPAWANRFKGLKARASPSALKMLGTGLQPFASAQLFLGRWPRLVWPCTFGAAEMSLRTDGQ